MGIERRSSGVRNTTWSLNDAARMLRRTSTPAERALWNALRGRALAGLKVRRQHAVGPFVLDGYCPEHKLAIELDGAIHEHQVEYDQTRTEHLAAYGYRMLRFRNDEVLIDPPAILERIRAATLTNDAPPLPPLGEGAGG